MFVHEYFFWRSYECIHFVLVKEPHFAVKNWVRVQRWLVSWLPPVATFWISLYVWVLIGSQLSFNLKPVCGWLGSQTSHTVWLPDVSVQLRSKVKGDLIDTDIIANELTCCELPWEGFSVYEECGCCIISPSFTADVFSLTLSVTWSSTTEPWELFR